MLRMSLAELASAAGVNEATIRNFEAGRNVPREDTLWKLQAALEQRGIIFSNGDKPTVTLDRSKSVIPT